MKMSNSGHGNYIGGTFTSPNKIVRCLLGTLRAMVFYLDLYCTRGSYGRIIGIGI